MDITYALGARISGKGDGKPLLTTEQGNYYITGPITSDYDGFVYFSNNKPYKSLAGINAPKPTKITHHLTFIEQESNTTKEIFYLTKNGLYYTIKSTEKNTEQIAFLFDCKQLYNDQIEGKRYEIEEFKKPLSNLLSSTQTLHIKFYQDKVLEQHTLISFDKKTTYELPQEWIACSTPFDQKRGMKGENFYYKAIALTTPVDTTLRITSARTYVQAEQQHLELLKTTLPKQKTSENPLTTIASNALLQLIKTIKPAEDHMASSISNKTQNAKTDQADLQISEQGIHAGAPWFHQYWMRDEGISIGPLIGKKNALCKKILFRWIHAIDKGATQALITGEGHEGVGSADGPGIIAHRAQQLMNYVTLTLDEKKLIYKAFAKYLRTRNYDIHGNITNEDKETWMDTSPEGQGRAGSRIEIQALTLRIYDLLIALGKQTQQPYKEYQAAKNTLQKTTQDWFYDRRGWIIDGFNPDGSTDNTQRPNIFLAWYFYPRLFPKQDWMRAFDYALKKLWLTWGGLASKDTTTPNFQPTHTGMNNISYHQGDSWFFINNIAAMALYAMDRHYYEPYIKKILDASIQDLLYEGYLGFCSEISDAQQYYPTGCRAQAWSASTLIELLRQLHY